MAINVSKKLYNFATSLVGNRVFDLYLKYIVLLNKNKFLNYSKIDLTDYKSLKKNVNDFYSKNISSSNLELSKDESKHCLLALRKKIHDIICMRYCKKKDL